MAQTKNLYLFYGLSDTQREKVFIDRNGSFTLELSGSPSFLNYLSTQKFNVQINWVHGTDPNYRWSIPFGAPIVNYIADPDSHANGLGKLLQIVNTHQLRCFNHPTNIIGTRRDLIAGALQGIPGVLVPRTIRLTPAQPEEFSQAFSEHGLNYPVILRLAGDHGGISTLKIDAPGDWKKIRQWAWVGRTVYMSDYLNYRDADGYFRKHRIVMIGGVAFLRHVIIGDQWMLHGENRLAIPKLEDEETRRLQCFETQTRLALKAQLEAIQQRIGLDFFGIDCHLSDTGVLTVFELNANMNCFFVKAAPPHKWQASLAQILAATEAVLGRFGV